MGDGALGVHRDEDGEEEEEAEDVTVQVAHNLQQLQQRLAQLDSSFSLGVGTSGKSSPALDAWLTGADAAADVQRDGGSSRAGGSDGRDNGTAGVYAHASQQLQQPSQQQQQQQRQEQQQALDLSRGSSMRQQLPSYEAAEAAGAGRDGAVGSAYSYAGSKSSRSASPLQIPNPLPAAAAAADRPWQQVMAAAAAAIRSNTGSPVLGLSAAPPAAVVSGASSSLAATWAPAAAAAAAASNRRQPSPGRSAAAGVAAAAAARSSKGSPIRSRAQAALFQGGAGPSPSSRKTAWRAGCDPQEEEEEGGWVNSTSSAAAAGGVAAAQRPLLVLARQEVVELQAANDALVSVLNRERGAAEQLRGRVSRVGGGVCMMCVYTYVYIYIYIYIHVVCTCIMPE
jgi:hypothetical protein